MGKWKSPDGTPNFRGNVERLGPVLHNGLKDPEKLAKVIETSYQPAEAEEKPSDETVNFVSALVLKYADAYFSMRQRSQMQAKEPLNDEEITILKDAISSAVNSKEDLGQIISELLNHYVSGSPGRVQEAEAARELFGSLSKVATKATLNDVGTAFDGQDGIHRTIAHNILKNLVSYGTVPEEVAQNIKSTLNTEEKVSLFLRWHGTSDFAAVIKKETDPLGILKVMEAGVIDEALTRTSLPHLS